MPILSLYDSVRYYAIYR